MRIKCEYPEASEEFKPFLGTHAPSFSPVTEEEAYVERDPSQTAP
jgi:hypothetical protein